MRKLLSGAAEFLVEKHRKRIWTRVLVFLACIIVFCTTYALILPAITMEDTSHSSDGFMQTVRSDTESEGGVLLGTSSQLQAAAYEQSKKMIHLISETANVVENKTPVFGQNVSLEKGTQYTISYKYKFVNGNIANINSTDGTVWLRVKDAFGHGNYDTYFSSHLSGFDGWKGYNFETIRTDDLSQ